MSDIDTVAEAIWRANKERNPTWGGNDAWEQQPEHRQDDYRAMARAAIDALQLTQEQRTLADGMGGVMTNAMTGEVTLHSRPCTRQSRLVTPWTAVTA